MTADIPVNPFLARIPWTGDIATDLALCPAWARAAVDALTLPTRGNVFAAVNVRSAAMVCMCRGGDRQTGAVFDARRGGLLVYRPKDAALVPHWDETFKLLMGLYLELFPTPTGAPAAGTLQLGDDTTRPMRRPPSGQ